MRDRDLADRPAEVALGEPELLADGFRSYWRYRLTLKGADGAPVEQTRDLLHSGKVVAVLPVDLEREEVVLIRQFRLAAHVATGEGEMIEIVAGGVESGEAPCDAAARECREEIGVAPGRLVELFTYLTTPGITDEKIVLFLAEIDAGQVPARVADPVEGEQIEALRVPIEAGIAALCENRMCNGPLLIALQWLALNRARLKEILASS